MKPCYTLAAAQEAHEEIGLALLRADEMPNEVADGLRSALASLSTVISDLDTEAQESAPPVSPDPQPVQYTAETCPGRPCSTECDHGPAPVEDPSPFRDVSTWKQGDRLRSSGGELATLLSVTRQRGPGHSAKVWIQWEPNADGSGNYRGEYYADVFTNLYDEGRA